MSTRTRLSVTAFGCALLSACSGEIGELPESLESQDSTLNTAQKKARCDQIKQASATKGVSNALLVAGIANHESGLAQCWSEASWHCQGPWSSDCGGPALAGSGDGPCSWQQGGIGMFQLDAGTFSQTLSSYGANVVTVAGNVAAGVDVIVEKVRVCPNTPSFGSKQEVIDFINSAKPGTANYETFITAMAWCYNGCAPHFTGCNHYAVRNAYKSGIDDLRNAFGDAYWNGPTSLASSGQPSRRIGVNPDGRLEAFVRGTDGAIWHTWHLSPGGAWSDWSSLGGSFAGEPVVASNADGRLEVFAVGTSGELLHRWQLGSGTWSSGWASLGGVGLVGEPAVAANTDGRLELIARSWDGQLWQKWQTDESAPFTQTWVHFGEHTTSDPVMARNADGRLEVFVRGGDQALWHRWQMSPNGSWSGWNSLGGVLVAEPAVGISADGRLEIFHAGTDGALYHRWQMGSGTWSNWVNRGGQDIGGEPSVLSNQDGRLEVFARTQDGRLWHKWQLSPNGAWSGQWLQFGEHSTSDPQVARTAAGQLEVFVRGGDHAVWHRWQLSPNGNWGGWSRLGGELSGF